MLISISNELNQCCDRSSRSFLFVLLFFFCVDQTAYRLLLFFAVPHTASISAGSSGSSDIYFIVRWVGWSRPGGKYHNSIIAVFAVCWCIKIQFYSDPHRNSLAFSCWWWLVTVSIHLFMFFIPVELRALTWGLTSIAGSVLLLINNVAFKLDPVPKCEGMSPGK